MSCSYILNRGWIDKSERRVPTYKEVTSKSKSSKREKDRDKAASPASSDDEDEQDEDAAAADDDEDATFEEAAEHFEEDYQFRFQEPYVPLSPSALAP